MQLKTHILENIHTLLRSSRKECTVVNGRMGKNSGIFTGSQTREGWMRESGGVEANKLKSVSLIRSTLSSNKRQSPTPSLKPDDCRPGGFYLCSRLRRHRRPTPVSANRPRGRWTRPCEATTPRQTLAVCARSVLT